MQPWITPSIFENTNNPDIIDEYTFGQLQDRNHALSVLQNHWETWITEDDFASIKDAGLNHVRYVVRSSARPLRFSGHQYYSAYSITPRMRM